MVTADTPAARELLTDGADAMLVPPGDPAALAEAPSGGSRTGPALARAASRRPGARRTRRAPREEVLGARWRALLERALAARMSRRPASLASAGPARSPPGSAALAVLQHRAFWTGRFDVGNLAQAVWSTAHGDVSR